MLLHEPPRSRYDLHFVLWGVPVRVHWMFWFVGVCLALAGDHRNIKLEDVLIWVAVLFVSILVHEFGHALAYRRYRYEPRVVLYSLGGLAMADMTYAVRPPEGNKKIVISAAGPAAGFLLAGLLAALLYLVGRKIPFYGYVIGRGAFLANENVAGLLFDLFYVNIFWGLINLLPVFPLDGGQISREAYEMKLGSGGIAPSLKLSMFTGVAAAVGFLFWLGFKEGLFPAVLFGVLAYSNYAELRMGGGYDQDDEGESWRRGRGERDW